MICDAKKMRELLDENTRNKKYTANDVLNSIFSFDFKKTDDIDSHYFRVEMIDINPENTELLNFQEVKNYLSFVAPVPYQNSFLYRTEIYGHAKELGTKIDEYNITLNGEPIFKKYSTKLKDSSGHKYDDIFGIHFNDFYNKNGELIAWMWVGISMFKKAIPKINQMRGIRLRKENIQIGGEDALQKLFKQDRGNSYFIGEVFAVDKNLIPNSQRDYFNENPTRAEFENELRRYFNEELHKVYYDGSAINSAYKKINAYEKLEAEFRAKEVSGSFVDEEHRKSELKIVLNSKAQAEDAKEKIRKVKEKADDIMQKVIQRIEKEQAKSMPKEERDIILTDNAISKSKNLKIFHRTDKLSSYSKSERKLISKIFSIIISVTDRETAEYIISKIEEGLQ
jgi:ElaB/YqjD/DUF883 family membrane-anchored ribosome-binding protein